MGNPSNWHWKSSYQQIAHVQWQMCHKSTAKMTTSLHSKHTKVRSQRPQYPRMWNQHWTKIDKFSVQNPEKRFWVKANLWRLTCSKLYNEMPKNNAPIGRNIKMVPLLMSAHMSNTLQKMFPRFAYQCIKWKAIDKHTPSFSHEDRLHCRKVFSHESNCGNAQSIHLNHFALHRIQHWRAWLWNRNDHKGLANKCNCTQNTMSPGWIQTYTTCQRSTASNKMSTTRAPYRWDMVRPHAMARCMFWYRNFQCKRNRWKGAARWWKRAAEISRMRPVFW